MCGIAGWLGGMTDAKATAARVAAAMVHRGPDGARRPLWRDAALVHTRLSIIDLSDAVPSRWQRRRSVWTVFNGEIYNHRELRRTLEARGHVFRGHADSEILPHLFEEEGPRPCLGLLRGMFAFAVYDSRRRYAAAGARPLWHQAAVLRSHATATWRSRASCGRCWTYQESTRSPILRPFMTSRRCCTSRPRNVLPRHPSAGARLLGRGGLGATAVRVANAGAFINGTSPSTRRGDADDLVDRAESLVTTGGCIDSSRVMCRLARC